jgi:selenocysteine lyase/cysteine desulfurase
VGDPQADAPSRPLDEMARDEDFWLQVQQAYQVDRSIVNLNNGGVAPAPRTVIESFIRLTQEANHIPSYELWRHQEQHLESVRTGLASLFGCDAEEIAITRNASEALETAQMGIDLKPGDEVVISTQDYPRMLTTWDQRARREGIVVKKVTIDVPVMSDDAVVRAYEEAITPRTRVLHASQTVFLTGQILPVDKLCALARKYNLISIIDGAHAFAQFPTSRDAIGCDMYGTSLHKWLSGPIGTGMLYVRKDLIPNVWSLMGSTDEQKANIRKYEEIGTHSAAMHNALADAILFNKAIGFERKAARFRYLHSLWTERVGGLGGVSFNTNIKAPSNQCALINVHLDGVDHVKLSEWLLGKHNIFTVAITHDHFTGLRITPNVYTTVDEMQRFAAAMELAVKTMPAEIRS